MAGEDALAWAMICQGIGNVLHYLDDFFFCAATASAVAEALGIALPLCTSLGLPVAPQKVEGPSTTITFLGIQLDTVEQEIRLPRQKLIRLQGIVDGWTRKKCATKHQLSDQAALSLATLLKPQRFQNSLLFGSKNVLYNTTALQQIYFLSFFLYEYSKQASNLTQEHPSNM